MTTEKKRSSGTLRAMLTRRDKKIAALTSRNADIHAQLADAVRLAKQLARENAALRNNIEVLQRPHRMAARNAAARRAFDALQAVKKHSQEIEYVLDWYERETRVKL